MDLFHGFVLIQNKAKIKTKQNKTKRNKTKQNKTKNNIQHVYKVRSSLYYTFRYRISPFSVWIMTVLDGLRNTLSSLLWNFPDSMIDLNKRLRTRTYMKLIVNHWICSPGATSLKYCKHPWQKVIKVFFVTRCVIKRFAFRVSKSIIFVKKGPSFD